MQVGDHLTIYYVIFIQSFKAHYRLVHFPYLNANCFVFGMEAFLVCDLKSTLAN